MNLTFESEDLNSFSFLDVKITHSIKRFVTSIPLKASFSGVFPNRVGLFHMLLCRCFKICFSMENFQLKVEHQRSIFKCINGPVIKIDQYIKKILDRLYVPKQFVPTVPSKECLNVFPFLDTFSMNLRIRFYKSVSKTLPQWKKTYFSVLILIESFV